MSSTCVRLLLPVLTFAAGLALLGSALAGDKEEGFTPLFNGKDFNGWKFQLGKKDADPSKTFTVKDGAIHVSGSPGGYVYTDKSYQNYILRFEWKFLKDGNSGILVHIQPPHRVWPKCIEVQGMQRGHGAIFGLGAKGKFSVDKDAQKKAIKIGEWNSTEILSQNGELTSKVNGIQISTGECELKEGPFGFQSEGVPLLFKNIRIKVLD